MQEYDGAGLIAALPQVANTTEINERGNRFRPHAADLDHQWDWHVAENTVSQVVTGVCLLIPRIGKILDFLHLHANEG